MSEKATENMLYERMKSLGYTKENNIYEHYIDGENAPLTELLKTASKKGTNKPGRPDLLFYKPGSDMVIVCECKESKSKHKSKDSNKPADYAVDGVIHYMETLSKDYNVIGIAMSGTKDPRYSIFKGKKSEDDFLEMTKPEVLSWEDFEKAVNNDPVKEMKTEEETNKYARWLHNYMRDNVKLTEEQKPLLVSAALISLYYEFDYTKSYIRATKQSKASLSKDMLKAIREGLSSDLEDMEDKIDLIMQPYSFITVHPEMNKNNGRLLLDLMESINKELYQYVLQLHDKDIVGNFYGEFLRYTGGDKKGLGIVLTPHHIAELFVKLAGLTKDSIVYDPCCGTGGFLIQAMKDMVQKANGDTQKIYNIKSSQLIGVEQQPNMYTMGCANMLLRGDGKANVYQGSCFNSALIDRVKTHKPNVSLLNPPYAQKEPGLSELDFIKHALDTIEPGSLCISIVPMSCAIDTKPAIREQILQNHTLEAVMSMPDNLFYPVGVVPCVIIFKAGIPHETSNKKTWFGYFKDDGFVIHKINGRCDMNDKWGTISQKWVEAFTEREVVPGLSCKARVTAKDEWCYEAYTTTDYSVLNEGIFKQAIKDYVLFELSMR